MPALSLLNQASVAACAPLGSEQQCHVGKRTPSANHVHRGPFLHQKLSSLVSNAPNVPPVSQQWRLARPLRTLTVNATVASSCCVAIACAPPAPNAYLARASFGSAGPRETPSARCVAQGPSRRTKLEPNHARTAHNALTMRWRSAPACPTPTLCAWTGSCTFCLVLNLKHRVKPM